MRSKSCARAAFVGLLFSLLAGPVIAAEPVEVPQSSREIFLGLDQAKIFRFDQTIARVEVTRSGIVDAVPRSQTELSLIGIGTGRTPFFVIGAGGTRIYSGTVVVNQEAGHIVRIYRLPVREEKEAAAKGGGKTDFADDYWCSDVQCSTKERPQNR